MDLNKFRETMETRCIVSKVKEVYKVNATSRIHQEMQQSEAWQRLKKLQPNSSIMSSPLFLSGYIGNWSSMTPIPTKF